MIEIAVSKNGKRIYADLGVGHAATHFADDVHLLDLVREVVRAKELDSSELKFEYVFDRIVGECDLQVVSENDDIVYAIRRQRDRYTKFVKNKPRHQCSSVTVIIKEAHDGDYELVSAWIGHLVPSFPKLNAAVDQDVLEKQYWATHALAWGRQAVDETTVTSVCPW